MRNDTFPEHGPGTRPIKLGLAKDRRSLSIEWDSGEVQELSALSLRQHCRSSNAVRAQLDETQAIAPSDLRIVSTELIGSYALNISFSDGERRGIYPWAYLREIAAKEIPTESK
jgi:DUF971 family protein